MKTKFFLTAIIVSVTGISNAGAQVKHRVINRQHIYQGVKSGELTKGEAINPGDQKNIHQQIKLTKADGKMSASERKMIEKKRNMESREIYRKREKTTVTELNQH
jgi:hypothetical protein